ncbi:MAG: hypothetical protein HOV87_25000 [Catenulispora sp.]|nr:hypothetical protein [Catenulispora sp.]
MTDLIESEDELLDPQPAPGAAGRARLAALARRLRGGGGIGTETGTDTDTGTGTGVGGDNAADTEAADAETSDVEGGTWPEDPAEAEIDPRRRQHLTRVAALALALVAGASAAGVAVHKADLHRNASQVQDRVLLHLLGGGASLTYAGTGARDGVSLPDTFDTPMATDLTIGLRNDGARRLEITGVQIHQPGVDVVDPAPKATVEPGQAVALTTRITVRCTASDLPQAPTGATVTVRTAADKGHAAGAPTKLPLTFTAGSGGTPPSGVAPGLAEALPGNGQGQVYMIGSYVTDSFYRLCGSVLMRMPARISAEVPATDAGPQNPAVRYSLHIAGTPGAAQVVTKTANPTVLPGVSTETDLPGPLPIGASGVAVTVTDRITDCAAFGRYLAVHGGAATAPMWLSFATPVTVQAADPRFRIAEASGTGLDGLDALTGGEADLQDAVLAQVAAACPDL